MFLFFSFQVLCQFVFWGYFLGVISFYDKILEAENAKAGTPGLHGKNAAVPFAASRNIRFLFFFFFAVRIYRCFSWKDNQEYGVFRYSVHRYQKQRAKPQTQS